MTQRKATSANSKPKKKQFWRIPRLNTHILWLREHFGCEVIAMVGHIGQGDDMAEVARKAKASALPKSLWKTARAVRHPVSLETGALRAVYEQKYLLGTSIARPLLARRQSEIALEENADALSHGCTGKGNDQVRFELTYKAFAPHLPVIAPWQEWDDPFPGGSPGLRPRPQNPGRGQSGEDLQPGPQPLASEPRRQRPGRPGDACPRRRLATHAAARRQAPESAAEVQIGFEKGVPVVVNGSRLGPVELVETLNRIGGEHGIGRIDLVENRFVGMKSRGAYETPGGTLIVLAHRELEALCLDRETAHYKQHVALDYAELVYNGFWYTPLREALDAFFAQTQATVTGEVRLRLCRGNVEVAGRSSPYSLYAEEIASFTMGASYDQKDAEGFINLVGLPFQVRASVPSRFSAAAPEDSAVLGDAQDVSARKPTRKE